MLKSWLELFSDHAHQKKQVKKTGEKNREKTEKKPRKKAKPSLAKKLHFGKTPFLCPTLETCILAKPRFQKQPFSETAFWQNPVFFGGT